MTRMEKIMWQIEVLNRKKEQIEFTKEEWAWINSHRFELYKKYINTDVYELGIYNKEVVQTRDEDNEIIYLSPIYKDGSLPEDFGGIKVFIKVSDLLRRKDEVEVGLEKNHEAWRKEHKKSRDQFAVKKEPVSIKEAA